MNLHVLVGRVGKVDVFEKVVRFSVATSFYDFKEQKKSTEWTNCVVFGKLTEFAGKLSVGDIVEVQGRTQTTKYNDKEQFSTVVDRLEVVSRKQQSESPNTSKKQNIDEAIDDLPF